jgi:ribosomal protein L7/L12
MSTGTQIVLGVAIALVVFVVVRALRRRPAAGPPPEPLSGDLDTRLRTLVAAGRKIHAIKELRQHSQLSLKDAKDYVEALERTGEPPVRRPVEGVREETLAEARALVAAGKAILAVKTIRDATGWDLRSSKNVVDRLQAEQRND